MSSVKKGTKCVLYYKTNLITLIKKYLFFHEIIFKLIINANFCPQISAVINYNF